MKKLPQKSFLLIILGVVAVSVAALFIAKSPLIMTHANTANPKMTDNQIIQDLIVLEKAALTQKDSLPQGLNQMSISDLKGKETDYRYHVLKQPNTVEGSAGGAFDLCAIFHARAGLDESSFDYDFPHNSPKGYSYHQQGMQCYRVSDDRHYHMITIEVLKDTPSWVGK